jgi:hypothetical protein
MPVIIPQPVFYHGHHRPMTEEEAKVLVGAIVVLTIIWVITSVFAVIRWRKEKKQFRSNPYLNNTFWDYFFFEPPILIVILNITMTTIYVIALIIFFGELAAKVIF